MYLTDIMIGVATILAVMFPAFMVKAVRSSDENESGNSTVIACVIFGAIVFIVLAIAR